MNATMTAILYPLLAQAGGDLTEPLGHALRIIMMFGFLFGTVTIISGAVAVRRGDTENGKLAIISGIIIAAAPAIMYALYKIFGLDAAAIIFK